MQPRSLREAPSKPCGLAVGDTEAQVRGRPGQGAKDLALSLSVLLMALLESRGKLPLFTITGLPARYSPGLWPHMPFYS